MLSLVTGGEANHNYHHAFPSDYRNGPRMTDWDPTKWTIYVLHHFTPFVPKVRQTPESEILKARAHVLATQADRQQADEREGVEQSSSFARWGQFAEDGASDGGSATTSGGYGTETSSGDEDSLLEGTLGSRQGLRQRSSRRAASPSGTGTAARILPRWTAASLIERVEKLRLTSRHAGGPSPLVLVLDGFAIDATGYAQDHPGGVALLRKHAVTKDSAADSTEQFETLNIHGWSARERVKELRIARIVA